MFTIKKLKYILYLIYVILAALVSAGVITACVSSCSPYYAAKGHGNVIVSYQDTINLTHHSTFKPKY